MGCDSCSNKSGKLPGGCNNNGWCQTGSCGSLLDVYDWLANVYYVDESVRHEFAEVRFKGTRKGFFRNVNNLPLEGGQAVAVEAPMGGYDVGHISLVGPLVKVQMKKYSVKENSDDIKKIYRIATSADIQKWEESKQREYTTQMKARVHAIELGLEMKISDVEYQADNTKATFYYTADGRVDFRELIKVFARNFKIKIEMRQIGLRQEAGRLGGIGSCGRELCCSTWLTDFNSVPTTAARYQNLFLNPLKLSGQCGRLKCCLNYELDTYMEALEKFPDQDMVVDTKKGRARAIKSDILKGIMYFIYEGDPTGKYYAMEIEDVKILAEQIKAGVIIEEIDEYAIEEEVVEKVNDYKDTIEVDSIDRFERKEKKTKKKKRKPDNRPDNRNQPNRPAPPRNQPEGTKDQVAKPGQPNSGRPTNTNQNAENRNQGNRNPNQQPSGENQKRRNNNRNRPRPPRPDGNNPVKEN